MKCPIHSHYDICASACPASCEGLAPPPGCRAHCEEGCSCDEGYILSGDQCVPFSQCGCLYNDLYYRINEVFYPNGQCEEECKCTQDGEVKRKTDSKTESKTLKNVCQSKPAGQKYTYSFLISSPFFRLHVKSSNVALMKNVK